MKGGGESFAVVGAIGGLAIVVGLPVVLSQRRRHDGKKRTPYIGLPAASPRGRTTLRAPALSRAFEPDLNLKPFLTSTTLWAASSGTTQALEMRTTLTVNDHVDLDQLPQRADAALERIETTTGVRPDPVQITVRFRAADRQRQLS